MRRVFHDREWAHALGARARQSIQERLAPEVVGAVMKDRLQRVAARSTIGKAPRKKRLARLMRKVLRRHRARP
jgi:hypothetical protein